MEFVLPEKWCIKRTPENYKVINDYLNKRDNIVTWHHDYDYVSDATYPHLTTLGYTEITFDQFKKFVLKQEEFTFDKDNWCIQFKSGFREDFLKYFGINNKNNTETHYGGNNDEYYGRLNGKLNWEQEESWGTELTFEQFKKYILNMGEKKIIGYKAPFDMFEGKVKKGDRYIKSIAINSDGTYRKDDGANCYWAMPKEIVETWEPYYEVKKTLPEINGKVGGFESNKSRIIYGCAEFDRTFFEKLLESQKGGVNRRISSILLDSGVTITMKQVEQIVEFLKEN